MNKSLDYGNAAPRLLENGYEAVPIVPGTKRPAIEKWTETNFLEGEKGLILPIIKQQFSANMRGEEVNDFLSVHSVFYPQIEDYFNIRIREIWRDLFDKND